MDLLATLPVMLRNALFIGFFLGFSIFIHELGHFLVARWRGLHIERFSIGFGHGIIRWKWWGVPFQIGWIPLGGFVALPQLDPTNEPQTKEGIPLPAVKPLDRILVALAGPLSNIAFGLLLGVIIWKVGIYGLPPSQTVKVAYVPQTFQDAKENEFEVPEWSAGLRANDIITHVNGEELVGGWPHIIDSIVFKRDGNIWLQIDRNGQAHDIRYQLVKNPYADGVGYPFFTPVIPSYVKYVFDGPAREAGVQPGDQLLSVNGKPIDSMLILQKAVRASHGAPVSLVVERGQETVSFLLKPREREYDGQTVYAIGVQMEQGMLYHPLPWERLTKVARDSYRTVSAVSSSDNPINPSHFMGIWGMVVTIWKVLSHSGWIEALNIIVFINFALAIFNLLPIPILDGGHITQAIIESVIRRRMPPQLTIGVFNVFAALLISFMIFVLFHDARRSVKPPPRPPPVPVSADEAAAPAAPAPELQHTPAPELAPAE